MLFADGKAVWSWHPLLVSSQRRLVGPTGLLDQPYSLTTVTRRIRSPGRARNKPLKPLRRECRVFRGTCGDYARVLYLFRTRGCGCIGHPAFPCALLWGGRFMQRLGRIAPRDCGVASEIGCLKLNLRARTRLHLSLVGEVGSARQRRDDPGEGFAPSIDRTPSPQPSPTRGEGARRRCRAASPDYGRKSLVPCARRQRGIWITPRQCASLLPNRLKKSADQGEA
jgi:hypothetical protein